MTCQDLLRSPRSALLLGVPNAALAIVGYGVIGASVAWGWPLWIPLSAASAALAMSVFLMYTLLLRRQSCRICWAGHVANIAIWIAVVFP